MTSKKRRRFGCFRFLKWAAGLLILVSALVIAVTFLSDSPTPPADEVSEAGPTSTLAPSPPNTATPSNPPEPTVSPSPTMAGAHEASLATSTATSPTETPEPTSTPSPTVPVVPTETSAPTRTLIPTETPTTSPTSATSPAVAAQGPSFIVDRDSVNVRAGPGTDYPVIGAISSGRTFTPTGRNQANDWLRFNWEGGHGWVYASLMSVRGLDEVPIVSAPRPPIPPTSTPYPAQAPSPTTDPQQPVSCPKNCGEAHNLGMSNMSRDHACYQPKFDKDEDGIACEK